MLNRSDKIIHEIFLKAVEKGELENVKSLLQEGADINYYNYYSAPTVMTTALIQAVRHNRIDVVTYLLSNPKLTEDTINFQDFNLRTAFMWAAFSGHINIVNLLLLDHRVNLIFKNQRGITALMEAAYNNQPDVVKALLASEREVGMNWKAGDGDTAFMLACIADCIDVVKVFLSSPAIHTTIKQTNTDGHTAFMCAVKYGRLSIVNLLWESASPEERSAMINQQTPKGDTALMLAAENGRIDTAIFLLENGANINHRNKLGKTPFMCAALGSTANTCKMVELFLEKAKSVSAMVNETMDNGNTALILVAGYFLGRKEVVRLLLEKGATVDHENMNGNTAIDFAKGDILALLREAGAKSVKKPVQGQLKDILTLLREAQAKSVEEPVQVQSQSPSSNNEEMVNARSYSTQFGGYELEPAPEKPKAKCLVM